MDANRSMPPSLWKPSIDGLSPLLGRTYPDKDWNPLDGRIVRLGLHKTVDPSYGREVSMDVHGTCAQENWPELAWLAAMASDNRSAFFAQHPAKQRICIERAAYRRAPSDARPTHVRAARPTGTGSADILIFRDDDRYLAWIAANPVGFAMNIQRSLNAIDARVHRAARWTIAGEPAHGKSWTGPYIKLYATELRDLDNWAAERFQSRIARCGTCLPSVA